MIDPMTLLAGLRLIREVASSDEKENEKKVVEVFQALPPVKKEDTRKFWQRKTFWAMGIGIAAPIVSRVFGVDLNVEELASITATIIGFMAHEGWRKK